MGATPRRNFPNAGQPLGAEHLNGGYTNACSQRGIFIYRLEEELLKAMQETLVKEQKLVKEGTAVVQKVFNINDKSGTVVAGLRVLTGKLKMKTSKEDVVYKVIRKNATVNDKLTASTLRRFKDIVSEVEQGMECGITMETFKEFEEGDEIECYRVDWVLPTLQLKPL